MNDVYRSGHGKDNSEKEKRQQMLLQSTRKYS